MAPSASTIRALVAQGEGERLEFKQRLSRPLVIARTLAAFANTRGGVVLIGVDDAGRVLGVRDPEQERYVLAEAVALTEPPVPLTVREVELDTARPVLHVTVPESPRKPHTVRFGADDDRVYVRAGAESVETSTRQARVLRHEPLPTERPAGGELTRHEAAVLAMFDKLPRVTVAHVRQLLNLSERRARQLLLGLTLSGRLLEHDRERTLFYTRVGR